MELRDYFSVFRKHFMLIVMLVIVTVAGALIFRASQETQYEASRAITVTRVNVQETPDYKFDDFYAIQASEFFSRTLIGWIETPAIVLDIYDDAGITAPTSSLSSLARLFKGTRIAPQVIQVEFKHNDATEADTIADSIITVIQREVDKENSATEDEAYFNIEATKTVVVEQPKNYAIVGVVAFLVGLFIAYNLALLLHYLAKGETKKS